METRANFILIGLVTLCGVFGVLGFFVWLARVEIDRQYDEFDVLFESVSGLSRAADVRFNGLSVGQVLDLELDENDPTRIRVRIEVIALTPIKKDTVAQLNSQGVTGVSYVGLVGGSANEPLLIDSSPTLVPVIPSERSVVQALTEDAPNLVEEAIELLKNLQTFVGSDNQAYVGEILANLERASGSLDKALEDFSSISRSVEEGASKIGLFTDRLDVIAASVETTLTTANDTLQATEKAVNQADVTLQAATEALTSADQAFDSANAFIKTDLASISTDVQRTLTNIETTVADVGTQVSDVGTRLGKATDLASSRLTELESTIASLDQTLENAQSSMTAVESASVSFEELVYGDGAALVSEARLTLEKADTAFDQLNQILAEDVTTITANISTAVETANRVIDQIGTDVKDVTQSLDPLISNGEVALAAATETIRGANVTLARVESALASAERTFTAAETTFTRASGLIENDAGPALADIRSAAGEFETTMSAVADDIPAVTQDLRDTIARVSDVIKSIDTTVANTTPPIRAFAETGLPQFTSFARSAQALVTRLDRLTRQIESNPTRFILGQNPSPYKQ